MHTARHVGDEWEEIECLRRTGFDPLGVELLDLAQLRYERGQAHARPFGFRNHLALSIAERLVVVLAQQHSKIPGHDAGGRTEFVNRERNQVKVSRRVVGCHRGCQFSLPQRSMALRSSTWDAGPDPQPRASPYPGEAVSLT